MAMVRVTLSLARFSVRSHRPLACVAVAQTCKCGVRKSAISEAAAPRELFYASDRSHAGRPHAADASAASSYRFDDRASETPVVVSPSVATHQTAGWLVAL